MSNQGCEKVAKKQQKHSIKAIKSNNTLSQFWSDKLVHRFEPISERKKIVVLNRKELRRGIAVSRIRDILKT